MVALGLFLAPYPSPPLTRTVNPFQDDTKRFFSFLFFLTHFHPWSFTAGVAVWVHNCSRSIFCLFSILIGLCKLLYVDQPHNNQTMLQNGFFHSPHLFSPRASRSMSLKVVVVIVLVLLVLLVLVTHYKFAHIYAMKYRWRNLTYSHLKYL